MAYNQEVWDKAKCLFELGKSLQEISDECNIKDRTSISRKAKKEKWTKKIRLNWENDDFAKYNITAACAYCPNFHTDSYVLFFHLFLSPMRSQGLEPRTYTL